MFVDVLQNINLEKKKTIHVTIIQNCLRILRNQLILQKQYILALLEDCANGQKRLVIIRNNYEIFLYL